MPKRQQAIPTWVWVVGGLLLLSRKNGNGPTLPPADEGGGQQPGPTMGYTHARTMGQSPHEWKAFAELSEPY